MESKDKHINKFLDGWLPDPEVPADDAWATMRDELDVADGQVPQKTGHMSHVMKAILKFKGFLAVTSAVAILVMIAFIVFKNETTVRSASERQPVSIAIPDSASDHTGTNGSFEANEHSKTSRPERPAVTDFKKPATSGNAPSVGLRPNTSREAVAANTPRTSIASARNPRSPVREHTISGSHQPVRSADNQEHENIVGNRTPENSQNPTEFSVNGQRSVASFSLENPPAPVKQISELRPVPGHFESTPSDLTQFVKNPVSNAVQPMPEKRRSVLADLHFGPEWSVNRSIVSTDYMFTGADSTKRIARVAIPGVFVSKTWNRHTATFIFNPVQTYISDKERVAQQVDTIVVSDSIFHKIYHNTNFIKAFGIDFSLQYQYRLISELSLMSGISYTSYSAALLRKETEYDTGAVVGGSHVTVKGKEALQSYMRPQQWNIRAGLLFHSPSVFNSRLQIGWTMIIPVSNLSLDGFKRIKTPNNQVSLRFLIR